MLNTRFAPWPSFSEAEALAVADVVRSNHVNYWTGERCREFERRFAAWTGTQHAVALANGTLALDVALKALGIGPGDEVVVTPRTFLASVSCVVNAGATPVFADVDRNTQGLSAETIAPVLTSRTRAILPVHLGGMPCDMDPIMALAQEHGLFVVEDCAQAHGATYHGRSVGSIGHIGAWSFCQDKIITTGGEGGMVTTNDPALWARMWSYKDHGKDWDAVYHRPHPPGPRLVHDSFGTNWRMLEMQAAIGLIQMDVVDGWVETRRRHATRLAARLHGIPGLRVPHVPNAVEHAYYRFYAFLDPARLASGWSRDRVIGEISARGGFAMHGSASEVYLEKAFDGTGWRPDKRLPAARELGDTSLCFLVHPTLSDDEIDAVCDAAVAVLREATAS
ncbi:MAG: DegT/DnrJ/EryC1/StrS family aminotransferase [Hyphomicrobiaceae bacterium]